ncbi:MAG: cupin domain-containing protein [Saprospiraceae bacterium]
MKGYKSNIEKETKKNSSFRKVLYTSPHSQLVLMTLQPKEEIGTEIHKANDQFFRIESGNGKCIIDGNVYRLKDGDAVIVPTGAKHNIINTDRRKKLKIYTIYSPPHHKDGIIRKTKDSADENEEHYDGITTEKRKKPK